jgi:hypothetical protein
MTTLSKRQQKDQSEDDEIVIAWTEPRNPQVQKARRVKLWLKHSITTLSSPSAEFEHSGSAARSPRKNAFRDAARKPLSQQQQRQQQQNRNASIPTVTSRKTTATIDQAMFSLYTYVGPKKTKTSSAIQIEPETPSSYVPTHDYDWMLDGREDWKEDDKLSQEYVKVLNEPWDMESFLEQYLQDHDKKLQQEELEEEIAFQFDAKFEDSAFEETINTTTANEDIASTMKEEEDQQDSMEDDDDFGDFQAAELPPTNDDDLDTPTSSSAALEPCSDAKEDKDNETISCTIDDARDEIRDEDGGETAGDSNNELECQTNKSNEKDIKTSSVNDCSNNNDTYEQVDSPNSQEQGKIMEERSANQGEPSEQDCDQGVASHSTCGAGSNHTEKAVGKDKDSANAKAEQTIIRGSESVTSPEEVVVEDAAKSNDEAAHAEDEVVVSTSETEDTTKATEATATHQSALEDNQGDLKSSEAARMPDESTTAPNSQVKLLEGAKTVETPSDLTASTSKHTAEGAVGSGDQLLGGKEAGPEHQSPDEVKESGDEDYETDDDFGEFCEASPSLQEEPPISTARLKDPPPIATNSFHVDDDDFGDFVDSTAAIHLSSDQQTTQERSPTSPTEVSSPSQQKIASRLPSTPGVQDANLKLKAPPPTSTSPVATLARPSTTPPASSSFVPTFAVLPPLKVDAAVKVQQHAEATLRQTESTQPTVNLQEQHQTHPHEDLFVDPFADPFSPVAEVETVGNSGNDDPDDGDDMLSCSSDESDDSQSSKVRISLRLPVLDLSTKEGRFTRRQIRKHKNALKMKQEQDQQQLSTASLFSEVDNEDEDGEPLLSLADLDLPHYYFTQPDVDDTARVLQKVPWRFVSHLWQESANDIDNGYALQISSSYSFEDHQDRRALFEEYITEQLCHLDTAQNQVAKHLLRRIQPHETVLQEADQSIHEFSTNLQLAQMYLLRSQSALRQAACGTYDHKKKRFDEGSGWYGAHDLLQSWEQQELYRNLDKNLTQIQAILDTEQELLDRISNFTFDVDKPEEYSSIVAQVQQLSQEVISSGNWGRLNSFDDLRERLKKGVLFLAFHSRLHVLAESVAVRSCRRRQSVIWQEYKALFEAVVRVQESIIAIEHADKAADAVPSPPEPSDQATSAVPELSASWPQTILQALCYEANRAFATALLDPIIAAEESTGSFHMVDSEFEKELTQLDYEIQQGWGDSAKLRSVTHNLVIIRFDWESSSRFLLPVYHRLCLLLADVLYAHHLFGQWHEKMVSTDDKKESSKPPGGDDCKEEKKSETAEEKQESRSTEDSSDIDRKRQQHSLQEIRSEWVKSREIIWRCCENVLIKCLDEYLHFASHKDLFQKLSVGSVDDRKWRRDLEELNSVLILTEQFVSLKDKFFSGDDTNKPVLSSKGRALTSDLEEKLCDVFRKNLRHVHVEAMRSLGGSLHNESWKIVSLKNLPGFEKTVSNTSLYQVSLV